MVTGNFLRLKMWDKHWVVCSQPLLTKIVCIADKLLTLVPVNLKDRDAFHISIEEYLHALISLIDELVEHRRSRRKMVLLLIFSLHRSG